MGLSAPATPCWREPAMSMIALVFFSIFFRIHKQYRVTQKASDLGRVDLDLECSIILLEQ